MTLSVIAMQCQLPREGELFPLTADTAFNGKRVSTVFSHKAPPSGELSPSGD
jgi:hypothetical protein